MSKLLNFILAALVALLFCAYIDGRATPSISYIDDINLSYNAKNDIWQCDMLTCPNKTVGCRILRYNDEANKTASFWRVNKCYSRFGVSISLVYEQNMTVSRKTEIEIYSFIGAETEVFFGYGNTTQFVNGSKAVAWYDWPKVQQQMRSVITEVDASNLKLEKKFVLF